MVEKEHIWVKCQWTNQDPSLLARSPCPTWMGKLSLEPRAFTVHGLDLHQLDFQKPPALSHLLSSGSPREPLPSCSLSFLWLPATPSPPLPLPTLQPPFLTPPAVGFLGSPTLSLPAHPPHPLKNSKSIQSCHSPASIPSKPRHPNQEEI